MALPASVERGPSFLGVQSHAPELVDIEGAAKTPDPFLLEDSGSSVLALYGDITNQEQGRENNHGDQSQQAVHDSFHVPLEGVHPIRDKIRLFFHIV